MKPEGPLAILDGVGGDRGDPVSTPLAPKSRPKRPKGPRDHKKVTFFTPARGHAGYAYSFRKTNIHPPGDTFLRASKPY